MPHVPIHLNAERYNFLIIGGGKVGERRVKKLLEAGAKVTLISKEFSQGLEELDHKSLVKIKKTVEKNEIEDLINDFDVIIAATDDKSLNEYIERIARKNKKLVNRADSVESDFIFPSWIVRNDIVVSISTQGKNPLLSKHLRERVEKELDLMTREKTRNYLNRKERKKVPCMPVLEEISHGNN
ncbi:MAG: bifunctional precorrin-2 dehydrogenase/sirohydrochlorin ferrochelatase [Candidatus Hydrothermarchaeota archaeon]